MAVTTQRAAQARAALLDLDSDLGRSLNDAEVIEARRALAAPVVRIPPGDWAPSLGSALSAGALGALVVHGLLVREVSRLHGASAELLGPGDVIRPWQHDDASFVPAEVSWFVPEGAHIAVIDEAVTAAIARWPQIAAELFARAVDRSHGHCLSLSLGQIRRLDHRTLLYLWSVGERFGRMTPAGVTLRLPLTHERLAVLVGAHRPSLTTAVRKLERAGLLLRGDDYEYVLTPAGRDLVAELAAGTQVAA